jgi:hypothetical protein
MRGCPPFIPWCEVVAVMNLVSLPLAFYALKIINEFYFF